MHTSAVLQSSDFCYRRMKREESLPADFASLFPNYDELDRIGVVSLALEDGILQVGGTLLALTTAFYDVQRTKNESFFNYPQHFALFGGNEGEIRMRSGAVPPSPDVIEQSWGNLDVWPDSNWHWAPATVEGMLRKVFDLQINRLFWPEGFLPRSPTPRFPNYLFRMLRSRLKAVYYYNTASPTMEVEGAPNVSGMIQRSLDNLPADSAEAKGTLPGAERFREVSASEFLETMSCCFEEHEA